MKFRLDSNHFILEIAFLEVFFRRPLEISLGTLRVCIRYLKGSPKVIHQYDCISKKVKKVWILKFEAQTLARIF